MPQELGEAGGGLGHRVHRTAVIREGGGEGERSTSPRPFVFQQRRLCGSLLGGPDPNSEDTRVVENTAELPAEASGESSRHPRMQPLGPHPMMFVVSRCGQAWPHLSPDCSLPHPSVFSKLVCQKGCDPDLGGGRTWKRWHRGPVTDPVSVLVQFPRLATFLKSMQPR